MLTNARLSLFPPVFLQVLMAPPGVLPETFLQFFKEDIQAVQSGYALDLGALGTVWVHGGLGVATTDMPQGSTSSLLTLLV